MSQFDWLLIGHFVGDYLLQTSWMATNKMKQWLPLIVHSAVYTLVICGFGLMSGGLSVPALGLVFVGHVVLDEGYFVSRWTKFVQTAPASEFKWLSIMADQAFHLIILAVAIGLSGHLRMGA